MKKKPRWMKSALDTAKAESEQFSLGIFKSTRNSDKQVKVKS